MVPLNYEYRHIADFNKIGKDKKITHENKNKIWYKRWSERILYVVDTTFCINPVKFHVLDAYYTFFTETNFEVEYTLS